MCSVVALLAVVSRLIRAAYLCDAIRQKAAPPTGCATQPRLACPFSNAPRVVDPANIQDDIQQRLAIARASFAHMGTMGDASEGVWLELLQTYLPKRYQAEKAFVVDSNGVFSDQVDVV